MNLDPRTLLFSLVLTYLLSAAGILIAVSGRGGNSRPDGMRKWAAAMLIETLTWILIAKRGAIPDFLSVVVANGFHAATYALILAAVYEFQQRKAPRWQYWLPVAMALVMTAMLENQIRSRFVWDALVYGFQMVLVGRALLTDAETRAGRAWRLMFGGTIMVLIVLLLRAGDALFVSGELAQPQNSAALLPVQLISYVGIMAIALLGSIGFVLMVKERTDREVMNLAMTDSLTQAPNRRALMEYAERVLARRSNLPVALMMVDLDHFKLINDTHGHLTGDEVLRKASALIVKRLRGHDLMGRYGGEEFCVIAPETDTRGAMVLAESLRAIIASTPIATDKGELTLTVSIGMSCCPATVTRSVNEVLAEADAALYDAKHSGRNKVVCFGATSA
jgi:diguanylate cyclase (GGDEF)-like protein